MIKPELLVTQNVSIPEIIEELKYGISATILYSPDKTLEVSFVISGPIAKGSTKIDRNEEVESNPGSTTLLYTKADELYSSVSRIMNSPLSYEFVTRHPKMIAWANDPEKGKRIFNWDYTNEKDGLLLAQKTYWP